MSFEILNQAKYCGGKTVVGLDDLDDIKNVEYTRKLKGEKIKISTRKGTQKVRIICQKCNKTIKYDLYKYHNKFCK